LQQANPSIESLLRDDISAVVGLAVDKALLHGTAAAKQPVGILNVVGIQTGSLATLTWAAIVACWKNWAWRTSPQRRGNPCQGRDQAANHPQGRRRRCSEYLMQNGRVAGLPAYVTNQLDAKTGSPDKGRVLAGDFSQM
jgi:hypothetical protein